MWDPTGTSPCTYLPPWVPRPTPLGRETEPIVTSEPIVPSPNRTDRETEPLSPGARKRSQTSLGRDLRSDSRMTLTKSF